MTMNLKQRLFRITGAFVVLLLFFGALYWMVEALLSLPFRETNDRLHTQNAPITLDFLIPAGLHIDREMTIRRVLRYRVHEPQTRIIRLIEKISQILPVRYRILTTVVLYGFWTFLFLVFFRIFTWMRYVTALVVAFLCGAVVYFFMPDMIMGRVDDIAVLFWSGAFMAVVRYGRRARKRARTA